MTQSTRTLLIIVFVLLVVVAAFLFLDFRISRMELATNSQASRFTISVDEGHSLPQGVHLDLYVEAPERLDQMLAEQLIATLDANPYVGAVTLRDDPPEAASGSVLVVRVKEPGGLGWTPFYTKIDADVEVAYASDGDVAWIGVSPVIMDTDTGQPVARVEATLALDGSGFGLISRPGYMHYLADELARQINELLQNQLATAAS